MRIDGLSEIPGWWGHHLPVRAAARSAIRQAEVTQVPPPPPLVCCDCFVGSVCDLIPPPYWVYLERQNIRDDDVRSGLPPADDDASAPPAGRRAAEPSAGDEPAGADNGWPKLGDVPPSAARDVVDRHVEVTTRIELYNPAGRLIDVFA